MSKTKKTAEGTNFTAVHVGKLNQLAEHTLTHPKSGAVMEGKAFLKDATQATGTEISYNLLPAKTELPYFHSHNKNEETYMILTGAGSFQVDDKSFEISEGSVIRVAPAGKRGMINTSDEAMVYIVIQSKAGSLEEYSANDGKHEDIKSNW